MKYTKSVVTIEEENRIVFEDTLNDYLEHEYSINHLLVIVKHGKQF